MFDMKIYIKEIHFVKLLGKVVYAIFCDISKAVLPRLIGVVIVKIMCQLAAILLLSAAYNF